MNNNTDEDTDSALSSTSLPYILRGEFFEITNKSTDLRIIAQCKNCHKTINGSRTSTGNFFSHYKVSYIFFYFVTFDGYFMVFRCIS